MKKLFLLSTMLFFAFCPATFINNSAVAKAEFDAFSIITDTHIGFYEEYIAKEKVVSDIPAKKIENLAVKYNTSPDKIKKVLVLQHALNSMDRHYSVEQLLNMKSADIVVLIKNYYDYLNNKLTTNEKEKLKADYNAYKKAHS